MHKRNFVNLCLPPVDEEMFSDSNDKPKKLTEISAALLKKKKRIRTKTKAKAKKLAKCIKRMESKIKSFEVANSQILTQPLIDRSKNPAFYFAKVIENECIVKAIGEKKTLYIYNEQEGYYKSYCKDDFTVFIFKKFKNPEDQMLLKAHVVNEIFHFLTSFEELQIQSTEFNNAKETLLNVKNGVLDIEKLELKPHDPKYLLNYYLNAKFNKNYPPPKKFKDVLKQCFDEKEDRQLCKESLAYTLSNNSSAKKIWFFIGLANTGKSMILNLMSRIIGEEFVAAIPLEKLDTKFGLDSAVNRRVNILAEVSNLNLKEGRTLKMISGGDKICVEEKYQSSYFTKIGMKFLLASNHLPRLDNALSEDDGIKNRFRFLGFYNSLKESERIAEYDKVLYEEEGDSIFSMLMEVLNKLHNKQYEFTETNNSRALAKKFGIGVKSSLEQFFEQCCRVNSSAKTACEDVYNAYEKFCLLRNLEFSTTTCAGFTIPLIWTR